MNKEKYPRLKDKEWLEEKVQNTPLRHIAKELGCSYSAVRGAVVGHGITLPKRTKYIYTEESRQAKSDNIKFQLQRKYPFGRHGELASNWKGGLPTCLGFEDRPCKEQVVRRGAKRCRSCSKRGAANSNWKGGVSELSVSIRSLSRYSSWRDGVLARDNWTCRWPSGCSVYRDTIEADHHPKELAEIIYEYDIQNVSQALDCKELWEIGNGRALCKKHHLLTLKGPMKYRKGERNGRE